MDVTGPRRLIEVDLPIREISRHARREKSIRHGHISTLHIWWARRPLAACRAVVLAALLPDPGDTACPESFRNIAADALRKFRDTAGGSPINDNPEELRAALLQFISRFAAWEASTESTFLDCARALVAAAHPDERPLVVDPFAGGGAIPLEALRVGTDAWAADYNPVAALLLKVVLEDIPRYGERLADAVRYWGAWVKDRVEADLTRFYPPDPDGAIPIAYLWARTVTCEGPGCGAEIPLLRQLWLAHKGKRQVALRLVVDRARKHVGFEVDDKAAQAGRATVQNGSAVCPVCHVVTPRTQVQKQLAECKGGTSDARLVAVVIRRSGTQGRFYRIALAEDMAAVGGAEEELKRLVKSMRQPSIPLIPDGLLNPVRPSPAARGVSAVTRYGMLSWGDLFLPRQLLALTALASEVGNCYEAIRSEINDLRLVRAVCTCLGIAVDRQADLLSSLSRWVASGEFIASTFSRQALAMIWDFAEGNPFAGSWDRAIEWIIRVCEVEGRSRLRPGRATTNDARTVPLPDESVPFLFSDPPYYDQIPYGDLSEFFAEWLCRTIGYLYPSSFGANSNRKQGEIVVNAGHKIDHSVKNRDFFRREMQKALHEARRVLMPDGLAVFVFAHKETEGWEALLDALISAGWMVTGSWPIETERAARTRARNAASLQSSVHIVCRPRTERAGVGDWRQVRGELERRVAEWLPRLAAEGVEGADAIFACLGPALEVYSRYERVETASGDPVPLVQPLDAPEVAAFLPSVWTAVAGEAMRMIFATPEAEGFEEDARLTALWLWTLRAVQDGEATGSRPTEEDEQEEVPKTVNGLALDYDTARKLAQALGAHLDELGRPGGILEVRKGVARLLGVAERRHALLGQVGTARKLAGTLFDSVEPESVAHVVPAATTLGRVQQAMLLLADGRRDALRRLLADPAYGADSRFRQLARALYSLYPSGGLEKRWVDGVLGAVRQTGN